MRRNSEFLHTTEVVPAELLQRFAVDLDDSSHYISFHALIDT